MGAVQWVWQGSGVLVEVSLVRPLWTQPLMPVAALGEGPEWAPVETSVADKQGAVVGPPLRC